MYPSSNRLLEVTISFPVHSIQFRGPMNEIMSYQYPPPGTPPPPYDTGYPVPPHSTGMDMRSPGQPGRNGSPAMSFDLKRSSSHPNVKMDPSSAAGLDEQTMAAGGDKKRGKLNYHRASTACSKYYPFWRTQDPQSCCFVLKYLILTKTSKKPIVESERSGVNRARWANRNARHVKSSIKTASTSL